MKVNGLPRPKKLTLVVLWLTTVARGAPAGTVTVTVPSPWTVMCALVLVRPLLATGGVVGTSTFTGLRESMTVAGRPPYTTAGFRLS